MSTVLEPPTLVRESLQQTTAGDVRWPGVRKTLSQGQRQLAAGAFSADAKVLSAGKKLFDTTHPVFRTVSAVKSKAVACWPGQTLPYVEPGIRLVRRHTVLTLETQLREAQVELREMVSNLDRCWGELVDQARNRLGDLFDITDYSLSQIWRSSLSMRSGRFEVVACRLGEQPTVDRCSQNSPSVPSNFTRNHGGSSRVENGCTPGGDLLRREVPRQVGQPSDSI